MDSLSFSCSLLDSSHGGSYGKDERFTPLEKQYTFFGKLQFPVKTDIDAWTEKVSFKIKNVIIKEHKNYMFPLNLILPRFWMSVILLLVCRCTYPLWWYGLFILLVCCFWQIKRLHLLLTVKESAMDVPSNLDARRRISFFSNSLFMDMPPAPKVRNMLSFS